MMVTGTLSGLHLGGDRLVKAGNLSTAGFADRAMIELCQWIIDRSDLVILAWNGLPPQGRSGTGDMASYARFVGCPFIQIDTRQHRVTPYGEIWPCKRAVA